MDLSSIDISSNTMLLLLVANINELNTSNIDHQFARESAIFELFTKPYGSGRVWFGGESHLQEAGRIAGRRDVFCRLPDVRQACRSYQQVC